MNEKDKPIIIAEYLEFFPEAGEFSVDVKFKSTTNKISTRRASIQEVSNLIQLLSNHADDQVCVGFDNYPCKVTDIRIDLVHKQVLLSANEF